MNSSVCSPKIKTEYGTIKHLKIKGDMNYEKMFKNLFATRKPVTRRRYGLNDNLGVDLFGAPAKLPERLVLPKPHQLVLPEEMRRITDTPEGRPVAKSFVPYTPPVRKRVEPKTIRLGTLYACDDPGSHRKEAKSFS